jgi:D-glycero-D-manno-heptose 1,7-bisphosphate phosphatase
LDITLPLDFRESASAVSSNQYCCAQITIAIINSVLDSTKLPDAQSLCTVFLDRDGVVNRKLPEGQYVGRWNDLHLLPGVPGAIARLNGAGMRVIVVSNQRGIALGLYTVTEVLAIHAALEDLLASQGAHIDRFYFCPHNKQECNCRKPLPGMFEQAAADFPSVSVATSVMIGDSLSDIEFGRRLGMQTIFIESDSEHQKPGIEQASALADKRFPSLAAAVDALLCSQIRTHYSSVDAASTSKNCGSYLLRGGDYQEVIAE